MAEFTGKLTLTVTFENEVLGTPFGSSANWNRFLCHAFAIIFIVIYSIDDNNTISNVRLAWTVIVFLGPFSSKFKMK